MAFTSPGHLLSTLERNEGGAEGNKNRVGE